MGPGDNELSKENAKLALQVNRLKRERDTLRKNLDQSRRKIQDHEQKIFELGGMLDNAMVAVDSLTTALKIKEKGCPLWADLKERGCV
jgi:predicted RNase H-like nuclease (RuvC/YqgF family)